jgi:amino acid transporter
MDFENKATSTGEKGSQSVASVESHLDVRDTDKVHRRLAQRHIQMMALAGTLGTGLFLGSGFALQGAGPLGALIAYSLVGTVAYSSLCAAAEMAIFNPTSGTFPHFAARWVDKALGFAIGWNYFYAAAIAIPTEISAASVLITFWDPNPNHAPAYIAAMLVVMISFNLFGVRYFGETEFYLCLIKITLMIGLIITGLVITLGGGPDKQRIGFRYWKNPGAVARAGLVDDIGSDRFIAILTVIVQAAFSFQSMEIVAITASETESPRRNIAKAVKRVFWRILIFYILGTLITGMLVPYNDPALLRATGNAAQSPYVIAIRRAGIKVLPSIINAAILTSAFSAGNSFVYVASRICYGLAIRGQAPKLFSRVTKAGLPLNAVIFSALFSLLTFMTVSSGAATVFGWFVNLSTVSGFIGWWVMNCTYLFFYHGYKKQGFDTKALFYHNSLQPYLSWWGIFWATFFLVISGLRTWFSWNTSAFITYYINIFIFLSLYFGYKIAKKTKIRRWDERDFVTGIPSVEETEVPEVPPRNTWEKIASVVF